VSRVLAAPDSLKGALRAYEAAAALAAGVRRAGAECDELPVGDGGEGTADAVFRAVGGEWREAAASDALGRPVEARFLVLPDGRAFVEAAEAIGLERLRREELDPLRATSYGLGELLLAALRARPPALLVGLGGSATVDGGEGLRRAVGRALDGVDVTVVCDVTNPLLGERGAAHVFGPQKGATPEMVEELEARLAAMAELAPFASLPGAGAAGGLGAALAALGARIVPGAELVLGLAGFGQRARLADLVVTGEGKVDRTTLEGKAVGTVVRASAEVGVRCVVFGGVVETRLEGVETYELSGAIERSREDLEELGERLGRALRS
jgi:glycerate kinase